MEVRAPPNSLSCTILLLTSGLSRRHVFRDLRPYICSHSSCPSADKLYPNRHDWIYHEMQMHRRQWTCQECQLTVKSLEEMATHLEISHASSRTETQRIVALGLYEQPIDETAPAECPLCYTKSPLKLMLEHLGRHLEELSLFALPKPIEDDDQEHDKASQPSGPYSLESETADKGTQQKCVHRGCERIFVDPEEYCFYHPGELRNWEDGSVGESRIAASVA